MDQIDWCCGRHYHELSFWSPSTTINPPAEVPASAPVRDTEGSRVSSCHSGQQDICLHRAAESRQRHGLRIKPSRKQCGMMKLSISPSPAYPVTVLTDGREKYELWAGEVGAWYLWTHSCVCLFFPFLEQKCWALANNRSSLGEGLCFLKIFQLPPQLLIYYFTEAWLPLTRLRMWTPGKYIHKSLCNGVVWNFSQTYSRI